MLAQPHYQQYLPHILSQQKGFPYQYMYHSAVRWKEEDSDASKKDSTVWVARSGRSADSSSRVRDSKSPATHRVYLPVSSDSDGWTADENLSPTFAAVLDCSRLFNISLVNFDGEKPFFQECVAAELSGVRPSSPFSYFHSSPFLPAGALAPPPSASTSPSVPSVSIIPSAPSAPSAVTSLQPITNKPRAVPALSTAPLAITAPTHTRAASSGSSSASLGTSPTDPSSGGSSPARGRANSAGGGGVFSDQDSGGCGGEFHPHPMYRPPPHYNPYLGVAIHTAHSQQQTQAQAGASQQLNTTSSSGSSSAASSPRLDASSPPVALHPGSAGHSRQASGGGSSAPSSHRGHRRTESDHASAVNASVHQQPKKPEDLLKLPLKEFLRDLKSKEAQYEESERIAEEYMRTLPESTHWKVYLELADIAKRENRLSKSRKYFKKVIQLQPSCSQAWLEYAKMEEECGKLEKTQTLLATGLEYSPNNEGLLVKALKLEERMGNLDAARAFLARLKNVSIDKSWKAVLEGALLEARAGNLPTARRIFKYLIDSMPWNGPVYQEACHLEEKYEECTRAIHIVERGLTENPRYGPLWFSALRLYERLSSSQVVTTRQTVERAIQHISKELIWKLYFEAAQAEERAGNFDVCRAAYVEAVRNCPENLLWKVWLGAARTELNINNIVVARKLLQRSLDEVPPKNRALVVLECARLEEYANNLEKARKILSKARKESRHEWRVFLESVLVEMRAGNTTGAIKEAQDALSIHPGNGRLWAVLIQLKRSEGRDEQWKVFHAALKEVPKSGEVWCEGARICIAQKNYSDARRFLDFAIQFTPQYGDSFIEYLLLELLEHGPLRVDTRKLELQCMNAEPNYGTVWLHCKRHPLDTTRQILRIAKSTFDNEQIWLKAPEQSALSLPNIFSTLVCHKLSDLERRKAIYSFDPIKP